MHSGGCLCGWIRFEAIGPAERPHTCSCKMCQRHTGALTAAWVEFPRDRVRWTGPGGEPSTFRSSAYSSRAFCGKCGSSIGAVDEDPTIALLVGGFDEADGDGLMPAYHSFEDGRPLWWCVGVKDGAA
ncbi:GFA family protein [Rhizobium sp. ARZ01]|uniref:GFA family protein n=1 Tax=Rhizobium sp. ARZ01 TaxID=2769313 RepID=UPI001AEEEED3|nr:GFA family protein [Rhizobium sp. ARZ01]